MEYFTVCCQRRGSVSVDGIYQGENKDGDTPRVFRCCAGLHDISLQCRVGQTCKEMTQRVTICGTNAIVPLVVRFFCDLQE
ncbi:hypothetical protein M1B72_17255 [Geomonas paludis]|uniref:Uncharacterized protein n=1 Tax=Geomonas paludis TaxID=2740185 RepID=A0A6V8N435_9BACT|nr:hypothetical protein [Geomonas paludis]UPU35184.1 hypothetical protein M1B72_17255 [Geomonas paludis]GFO66393.1 hypothetical protein GMPD_43120 [Geomonas paludis]